MFDEVFEKLNQVDLNPKYYLEKYMAGSCHSNPQNREDAEKALLLGRALLIVGKHKVAIGVLQMALDYFEQMNHKLQTFHCFSVLSTVLLEMKKLDQALLFAEKALSLSDQIGAPGLYEKALMNLAAIHSEMGDIDQSLELLDQAINGLKTGGSNKLLADLHNNYAHELIKENRFQEALTYLFKSHDLYCNLSGAAYKLNLSINLYNIGEVYFNMEMLNQSEKYLKKALTLAVDSSAKVIEKECHGILVKVYEKIGDYRKALWHFKTFDGLEHLISTEHEQEAFERIRLAYEAEIQSNEAKIHMLRNVELKSKTTELEKTLKNVSMIAKIGQELTSSMDLDEIFDILRKSIYKLMSVNVFGLALYNPKTQRISYQYFEENQQAMPLTEIEIHDPKSLAAYCILNNEDLLIKDFDREAEKYLPTQEFLGIGDKHDETTHCIIYCRLITESGCIGLITLQSYNAYEYHERDFELIKTLASYVAIATSNAQKKNILMEKTRELEYLSFSDSLTGLHNRRYFHQVVDEWLRLNRTPIGLVIADMNHLKQINDQFGHTVGDMYLIEVSRILKQCAGSKYVFRLGGDEFAILIPDSSDQGVQELIAQIQWECDRFTFEYVPLSVALGYDILMGQTLDFTGTFAMAESNMYREKNRYHFKKK